MLIGEKVKRSAERSGSPPDPEQERERTTKSAARRIRASTREREFDK
jgi:hypothetical protein